MIPEFLKQVQELIAQVKEMIVSKELTIVGGLAVLARAVSALLVLVRDILPNLDEEQTKQQVVAAAEKFYEEVIRPLDIPGVPNFLENTIVDPMIGKAIPMIVEALYEAALAATKLEADKHSLLATSAPIAEAACSPEGECQKRPCCRKMAGVIVG